MAYQRFDYEKCKELAAEVMRKNGIPDADCVKVADALLASDLFGIESHGIQRLSMYVFGMEVGRINRNAKMKIVKETPCSAVIDADAGMGQPASIAGVEMAIDKASKTGFGMVIVTNSNHYGSAGYYSRLAADKGYLGVCMTNTEALVTPTFGKSPMLGTNPIGVSMPAHPTMFHFDVSTSVVTAGKMEVYAKSGKPAPEGWSVDSDGKVNTDAQTFLDIRSNKTDGGLLPLGGFGELLGGHKGYGFSLIVELMTGVLGLGDTSPHVRAVPHIERCCHMFQVIDYGMFGDKEAIERKFSEYLQEIRDSKKAEGYDRIYIHGEKEVAFKDDVLTNGVPMHDATVADIIKTCEKCGVDHTKYLVKK